MTLLSESAFRFLKGRAPLKFVATVGEDGYPNLVPILSTIAWDRETLCFVRFMVWKTRRNLEERKRVAVSGLGLFRALEVLGEFVGFETSGERLDYFNNQPLYRYNAYFGAGQVGVIKVVEEKGWRKTELWRGLEVLLMGRAGNGLEGEPEVMPSVVREKFQRLFSVKYLSWIDPSGWPRLAPASGVFLISKSQLGVVGLEKIFKELEPKSKLALTVFSSEPNAYQVKGRFAGKRSKAGINYHLMELEKSFSAGPPLPGEPIYPKVANR